MQHCSDCSGGTAGAVRPSGRSIRAMAGLSDAVCTATSCRLAHGLRFVQPKKDEDTCSKYIARKSIGAGASSCSKPGASPARPTAPFSPPMARPRVLATVVSAKSPKPGQDFFPLTVNYQEKAFAAGRIPGGYFKREGRPSERETLLSRLIDRPIRPLFPEGYRNETQVVITVLSHDLENDPDVLAMVAASAALTISGIPFMGPVGARPRRLHQWRTQGQPDRRRSQDLRPRPLRRRHRRRRADGRIRGQGAVRRNHARRRHGRPRRLPAGDRGDHPPGRTRRQGAARSGHRRQERDRKGGDAKSPRRNCAKPTRSPPSRSATRRSTRSRPRSTPPCSPKAASQIRQAESRRKPSTTCKPRWCAGTCSTPASASTAAT